MLDRWVYVLNEDVDMDACLPDARFLHGLEVDEGSVRPEWLYAQPTRAIRPWLYDCAPEEVCPEAGEPTRLDAIDRDGPPRGSPAHIPFWLATTGGHRSAVDSTRDRPPGTRSRGAVASC